MFWGVWNKLGMKLPDAEDRNKCFMFELLTKHQVIIVRIEEDDILCHGVR